MCLRVCIYIDLTGPCVPYVGTRNNNTTSCSVVAPLGLPIRIAFHAIPCGDPSANTQVVAYHRSGRFSVRRRQSRAAANVRKSPGRRRTRVLACPPLVVKLGFGFRPIYIHIRIYDSVRMNSTNDERSNSVSARRRSKLRRFGSEKTDGRVAFTLDDRVRLIVARFYDAPSAVRFRRIERADHPSYPPRSVPFLVRPSPGDVDVPVYIVSCDALLCTDAALFHRTLVAYPTLAQTRTNSRRSFFNT